MYISINLHAHTVTVCGRHLEPKNDHNVQCTTRKMYTCNLVKQFVMHHWTCYDYPTSDAVTAHQLSNNWSRRSGRMCNGWSL